MHQDMMAAINQATAEVGARTVQRRRCSLVGMDLSGVSDSRLAATIDYQHSEDIKSGWKKAFSKVRTARRMSMPQNGIVRITKSDGVQNLNTKTPSTLPPNKKTYHSMSPKNMKNMKQKSRRRVISPEQLKSVKQLKEEMKKQLKAESIQIDHSAVEAIENAHAKKPAILKRTRSFDQKDKVPFTMLDELRLFYDTRHKLDEDTHEITGDNLHLYTDKALLQREAIKFDPGVQSVLQELYALIDSDFSGTIEKFEYVMLNRKLYVALRAFWDPTLTDLDVEELEDMAEDDWDTDSQGFGSLNRERFLLAMFQLCDIWTVSRPNWPCN